MTANHLTMGVEPATLICILNVTQIMENVQPNCTVVLTE